MKNLQQTLPEMAIETLYAYAGKTTPGSSTSTGSDNTTTCTTVLTTTHFDRK
jgi:hypothetical protein